MPLKVIPPGLGYAQLTEAVTTEYGQLVELVRQAVAEKLKPVGAASASEYFYVDVRGIWPDRVVVMVKGRLTSYPYTLDADNKVQVGDGAEVVADFRVVREAQALPDQASFTEAADGSIAVTLIRAGTSGNGNYYPDATLREAAPLFEGVRVFVKSDADHTRGAGKDVRGLIGGIYDVRFVEGKATDTGSLVGTFKPLDPADQVVTKMTEAVRRGMQNLLGLSIDAVARTRTRRSGAQTLREAVRFVKVSSVDLIVEPGAGGGLDRLVEAAPDNAPSPSRSTPGEFMLKKHLIAALLAIAATPAAVAAATPTSAGLITSLRESRSDSVSSAELITALHEACQASAVPYRDVLAACESAGEADDVTPAIARLVEAAKTARQAADSQRLSESLGDNAPVTRAELQMLAVRQAAVVQITGSRLPQVAKDRLLAQFNATARFTEADVGTAIQAESAYIARFTESGAVRVPAFGDLQVGDRSAAVREMLDAFFDPAHARHRDVRSFREAYVEITGDRYVTGQLADCDRGRMAESLGVMRESIDSATFANALGNSITRRMQAIYTGRTDLQVWRRVATSGPVSDFRSQERMRIGGYGNLPAVAQGAGYTALTSPGDEKASYAVSKRGGTEDVTLEAITNDDVQALRRIPQELALAAGNTLMEFVFDFFRTNPTIYDTVALYHASHNNLRTGALDATEFAAHRQLMVKQTRAGSNKRLGLSPKSILVPFELQETAYNLFVRGQNNDKTFVQDLNPDVIVVPYWTDANDWCTVADPTELPVVEVGFLNGREEPELFVQDMPNVGSMFSNDKLTYKIRHIYGGSVLVDGFKATTKAVVA
jgi:hypothetical protein